MKNFSGRELVGIIRTKDGKIIPGIDRDWRNPKDYEFTQSLNPHQWAWEFLRRNPEYRKDWHLALEEYLRQYPRQVVRIRGPGFAIHSGRSMEKWGITAYTNPEQDNPREVRFLRKPEIRGLVFGDIIVPHKRTASSILLDEGQSRNTMGYTSSRNPIRGHL